GPDRVDEVRQQTGPTGLIARSPRRGPIAESVPPAVLDLDPRAATPRGLEANLHLGRVGRVRPQVPAVHAAPRRLPGEHATPIVLDPFGRTFEDPTADPRLERDGQATLRRD